jgi:acyl-CoA thioester hydrolase
MSWAETGAAWAQDAATITHPLSSAALRTRGRALFELAWASARSHFDDTRDDIAHESTLAAGADAIGLTPEGAKVTHSPHMQRLKLSPAPGIPRSVYVHTVAFYETDGMGIVHHSNHVRFLELARVAFLGEHDQPYTAYVAQGFHVPVIRVDVSYYRPCRFADQVAITCWLNGARNASLRFAYRLEVEGQLAGCAITEHAIVDREGRPVRIPPSMANKIETWLGLPPGSRSEP